MKIICNLTCLVAVGLLVVPDGAADDSGWTVAIDPTTHRVVEGGYGHIPMVHRPLTVQAVPSALIERVSFRYLKWVDAAQGEDPADGLPQPNEIIEMSQAEKDVLDAPNPDTVELATLDAQLEADDTAWAGLTTAQKLAVMKKRLRADVLRRRLGR